jgi:hypothetical protein
MRGLAGYDGPGICCRSQRTLVPVSTGIYGQRMGQGSTSARGRGGGPGQMCSSPGPNFCLGGALYIMFENHVRS